MPRALATSRSTSSRRWTAVVAATSLAAGVLGLPAVPASAGTGDVTIPLPMTHAMPNIVVATGHDLLWADFDENETLRASVDDGKTWNQVDIPGFDHASAKYVTGGHVYYQTVVGDQFVVDRYDFATNTSTQIAEVADEAAAVSPTHALTVTGTDSSGVPSGYVVTDLATKATHALAFTSHHTSSGGYGASLSSGSYALVSTVTDAHFVWGPGYIDLLPLSGAKGLSARVSGLVDAALRGDQVVYLTQTKTAAKVCFRSAAAWSLPACRTLKWGNYSDVTGFLSVGPDWATVAMTRWPMTNEGYVVDGAVTPSAVDTIDVPAGTMLDNNFGAGDTDRPFVDLVTAAGGYLASYRADGTFVRVMDYPEIAAGLSHLAMTPAGLVGADNRPAVDTRGLQVWSRPVAGGVAGAETIFPARASSTWLAASDARMIMRVGKSVSLLDGKQVVRKLPSTSYVSKVSGAYYLAKTSHGNEMRRIDGTRVLKAPVVDIFGSFALKSLGHNRYEVVDVTGRVPVRKGTLPKAANNKLSGAQLWGDWIMAHANAGTSNVATVVFNYRTKEFKTTPGYGEQLGDSFAVVTAKARDWKDNLLAWNFTKDTTETLVEDSTAVGNEVDRIVTDGSHQVAWTRDGQIVVHRLAGVGNTPPVVLGAVAPKVVNNLPTSASWKPQFDATKGLAAGSLVIRNAAGIAVRTLASAATKDGSIRSITWNGRAEDGVTPVPAGTYTWELAVPAADGSGDLAVNTLAASAGKPVKGTVRVVRKYLGTVSGPAPRISDRTPVVGQTLTAAPGAWKPASKITLAYQWFRGGTAVGVNSATYTVTSADLGQKLRVTVTGVADGWRTKARSSGATAKVAAG
ncbi:MAG TPA: FlgD immunoglobulin-like domain containing protein [Propionicimonas sp.]|uniref:FlgD immunoglobulin-like domain containing protein n=1 Tax=Propionicimonas sp. TaxID=1955623 RepID=UPI002F3F2260